MIKTKNSERLFALAQGPLAGGVNSPVRAFKAVGGTPRFIAKAKGPYLWDADGNRLIDFVGSWGPMILGHAHPKILSAVKAAMARGFSFGASTELEIELARRVCGAIPSIQKVRFVSSGTEAVMGALRLARGFTKRSKVVKFSGCYHGHSDGMLVSAGSGAATLGVPDSAGVPAGYSNETLVVNYNDLDAVRACIKTFGSDIAAVIVEPVAGNMGVVPPAPGFLEGLRNLTRENGTLLIFDEVITGFRLAYGGAQSVYGVQPDLTCLGKIIGGGFPVGAFGGRSDVMELLAPLGPVYQAGTLSGNPVAMSAGIATLDLLKKSNPYASLARNTRRLTQLVGERARSIGLPVQINQIGSMFTIFFTDQPVRDFGSAKRSDTKRFARFFHALLDNGVYFPPAQFEAAFLSAAHTSAILETSAKAICQSLNQTLSAKELQRA